MVHQVKQLFSDASVPVDRCYTCINELNSCRLNASVVNSSVDAIGNNMGKD